MCICAIECHSLSICSNNDSDANTSPTGSYKDNASSDEISVTNQSVANASCHTYASARNLPIHLSRSYRFRTNRGMVTRWIAYRLWHCGAGGTYMECYHRG